MKSFDLHLRLSVAFCNITLQSQAKPRSALIDQRLFGAGLLISPGVVDIQLMDLIPDDYEMGRPIGMRADLMSF